MFRLQTKVFEDVDGTIRKKCPRGLVKSNLSMKRPDSDRIGKMVRFDWASFSIVF